eukprot:15056449-Heterocapsa_arctica.AAC.1
MPAGIAQFTCEVCPPPRPGFSSAKALASHTRARHGTMSPFLRLVNDPALCPACGASVCTPIRVLAHLSDARRPACR